MLWRGVEDHRYLWNSIRLDATKQIYKCPGLFCSQMFAFDCSPLLLLPVSSGSAVLMSSCNQLKSLVKPSQLQHLCHKRWRQMLPQLLTNKRSDSSLDSFAFEPWTDEFHFASKAAPALHVCLRNPPTSGTQTPPPPRCFPSAWERTPCVFPSAMCGIRWNSCCGQRPARCHPLSDVRVVRGLGAS